MNIAFDATAILGTLSKNRGVGNYALSQLKTMIERDPGNQYFVLNLLEEFHLRDLLPHAENLHEFYYFSGTDQFLLKDPAYEAVIGDVVKNFIREHEIDIFYITSPFEGAFYVYQQEWFAHTKVVATVYDIIPYVMKDHYLADKASLEAYLRRVAMLRWMDRLLVISQSVKDDLVNHLHFDADKIDVIYGAADRRFCRIEIPQENRQALLLKYGIHQPYIMCTGGDDERKNLEGLIVAYAKMPPALIKQYQLVIVCKLQPASEERYRNAIEQNHVTGRVVLTNFVSNEELIQLYNLACLLAYPSKYEGFGLPVVEAWACGIPVLTSNNSSLGEIAGDAAILINPFDQKDITRGLVAALTQTDLAALRKKSEARLALFGWDIVADLSIASLKKTIAPEAEPIAEDKARLAFFTPLPPIKSGISDYSVDVLNAISDRFDIDVFVDHGYQPDCALDPSIHVYDHHKFNAKKYKYILYQMGNSDYHVYMYPYIEKYGGILVLHDFNMHPIAYHISFRAKDNAPLYRKYLLEDFPASEVNTYLRNFKQGVTAPKIYEIELNGFVVNYADKVIVHSNEAKTKLLERNIARNVRKINSYAKIEPLTDTHVAKAAMGMPEDVVVFSAFGHIHETKRSMPSLKAFQRLCAQGYRVHYYFVGLADAMIQDELFAYIRENQLEDKVTVTGYIDLDAFQRYIDATDICVNLRYPFNGETSSSLMRILAKAKCVMVNDIGSFGEIPDDCCVKLPSVETMTAEQEIDTIHQVFLQLLADKSRIGACCANARAYAEQHLDLRLIAQQYVSFIKEDQAPSLTEQMLSSIAAQVQAKQYTRNQVEQLASTLGYSKNFKPDDE